MTRLFTKKISSDEALDLFEVIAQAIMLKAQDNLAGAQLQITQNMIKKLLANSIGKNGNRKVCNRKISFLLFSCNQSPS